VKTADDGHRAEYEAWRAVQFEPFVKPTELYFRDQASRRGDRTPILSVTPSVEISTDRPPAQLNLTDPTGTVPLGVEVPVWAEKAMRVTVQAPVDPEVELFAVTPTEGADSLALDAYLDAFLGGLERDLAEIPTLAVDPAEIRAIFEREYEPFIAGAGRIGVEIEEPRRVVGPGEPQEFALTLHPEAAGEMMMLLGARDPESGEVLSVSELLPLRWETKDKPFEGRASIEEPEPAHRRPQFTIGEPAPEPLTERTLGA
jgi:hypothetical protein